MLKKLSVLLLVLVLIPFVAALPGGKGKQLKTLKMDTPSMENKSTVVPESVPADGDYIEVDIMANAFGPASADLNPLAYDPYSNTVALTHRGHSQYAAGSGEIWYNISTDMGATWTRVAAVNGGNFQKSARYPSMAISNPDKGDISMTIGAFAWPELSGTTATFGWMGYGADAPLGGNSTFANIDTSDGIVTFSSRSPIWADDNSPWIFWTNNTTAAPRDVYLWRTQDFSTIEKIAPPQWSDTAFSSWGQYLLGGVSYNGVQYAGAIGPFTQIDVPYIAIGYSKSTDNGATWSDFVAPDFRTIPGLEDYDELMDVDSTDGTTVSYDGDIQVDRNGYVHIATAVTDTDSYKHAVVDLFETASGWSGKVVANVDRRTYGIGPGLGQVGAMPMIAMDSSHTVMGIQFIDKNPTTQWADIYFSYSTIADTSTWSSPVNLTNSAEINNTVGHLAPMMKDNGSGSYTAFSCYDYVTGATGPYTDTTATTSIYVAPVTFSIPSGVNDNNTTVRTFELSQNYPNPFNPSTVISYSIAERSNVSIKVFDILGREVASLVNEMQEAGTHKLNFNASKLSSGVYLYSINAGNYNATKKMMLMK